MRDLLTYVACGIFYLATALLALFFFATTRTPSAIWPGTGLLVAFLLIFPKRMWPGIATAAFIAAVAGNFITGKPLLFSLGLGAVDALEGLLSGVLLTRFVGPNIRFTRLRELAGLVFLSAMLANGIGAVGGAGVFKIFTGGFYWYLWRSWWLSHGIGILTLTPCIVSWTRSQTVRGELGPGRRAEAFLLLVILIVVSVSIFSGLSWSAMALPYIVFPLLIWAALRFGVQGASAAAVVLAIIAVWYTNRGLGPFAVVAGTVVEELLQVQCFVAAALVCSLVPAMAIAERKEAEEKLRKSEARLELAQEIASVGSFVMDREGNLRWSEEMFRITGRDSASKEPSHQEFLTCVHPEDRELVASSCDLIFRDGRPCEIDFRYICPEGSLKYLHATARPEIVRRAATTTAFGTVMDLTDRRRIEEQLRHAQKMEAVGRLAGGVAHDFNNLLGVIIGYTELALYDLGSDDPLRGKIEPISKAAVRAASLTAQLLAFSRRQVLKPEELDLNRIVADLEPMLKRLIGEGIEIVTELESQLPLVKADPGQMDQVIMNLALNSRDAMPAGGKLKIRTSRFFCGTTPEEYSGRIPTGEYVMLTVTDTGHGMDAVTKAHIFDPFFTTKEKGKGTGLGLSTVYGIVSQSNGHIWAESEVGKGTDFNIVLPVVKSEGKIVARETDPGKVQGRKETVLIVEDEASLRGLVASLVASMGCTALEAPNGDEAIAIARERSDIDVLLTDVVMPNMDGFELVKRIVGICPRIKVLYMSGYSDEMVAQYKKNENLPHLIQKPFRSADLIHKLRKLMDAPQEANS